MSVLYYFSLLRKNAVHKCESGLLAVKKWHIGRFDGKQKTALVIVQPDWVSP